MFKRPVIPVTIAYVFCILILFCIFPPQPRQFTKDSGQDGILPLIRDHATGLHMKYMSPESSQIFCSILLGSKAADLDEDTKERYRKSGVVHLLVASGQQVSILIGVVMTIGSALLLPNSAVFVLASVSIWSFAVMAGLGASISRAAIMGQIMLLAMLFKRSPDFYTTLSLSALVLLLFDPKLIFDIGFQLSFLATWSLVYTAPVIKDKLLPYLGQTGAGLFSVSIAPALATMPVTIYNFSTASVISFISNIFIVPAAEVMTTLGFMATFIAFLLPWTLIVSDAVLGALMAGIDRLVYFFSVMPFASVNIVQPGFFFVVCYYIALILSVEMMKKDVLLKNLKTYARPLLSAVFLFVLLQMGQALLAGKQLEISFIDAGQGDSIYVSFPDGGNMLIDAGDPKAGRYRVVPFLRKKGINRIDTVVLTHPHDDHVGGMRYVFNAFDIGSVWDSGFPHTTSGYIKFLTAIDNRNIPYTLARAGQRYDIGGAQVQVLGPFEDMVKAEDADANDSSVVIRIVYGRTAFLLTGDAPVSEEERMLESGRPLRSELIKVGHHGSRTSSSPEFIRTVRPKYAVVSVAAKNRYRLPSKKVISFLKDERIKLYRTDENGHITAISDGSRVDVITQR